MPVARSTRTTAPWTTPSAEPSPTSPPAATATASGVASCSPQGQSSCSRAAALQTVWKARGCSYPLPRSGGSAGSSLPEGSTRKRPCEPSIHTSRGPTESSRTRPVRAERSVQRAPPSPVIQSRPNTSSRAARSAETATRSRSAGSLGAVTRAAQGVSSRGPLSVKAITDESPARTPRTSPGTPSETGESGPANVRAR